MTQMSYRAVCVLALVALGHSQAFHRQQTFEVDQAMMAPSSLPVANPTDSFWLSKDANLLATEGSDGELTTDADVCIIGSGLTSISAAYHLAQFSAKSSTKLTGVVLEAREFSSGATGRNGGHLTPAKFGDYKALAEKYGADEAKKSMHIERWVVEQVAKIVRSHNLTAAVDFVRGGHVEAFTQEGAEERVRADFRAALSGGIDLDDVRWMNISETFKTYGANYSTVFFPETYNIWPAKFVNELYKIANKTTSNFNLKLHTRTPVLSVLQSKAKGRRWVAHTERGNVHCSYVIHGTNAYASHLLPQFAGEIVPIRGQVAIIQSRVPADELFNSSWSEGVGGYGHYWFRRPLVNKTELPVVMIGGSRSIGKTFDVTDDSVTESIVGNAIRTLLPSIYPGKFDAYKPPLKEWTGIMGFTQMGDPFVGPVFNKGAALKGQYISAGYSGHGMPRTFGCAFVVADMIAAEYEGRKWSPPAWLPDRYLTWNRKL